MKQTTVQILNTINKSFYEQQAASFSRSRNHPWPAFEKSWQAIDKELPRNPSIADVGCGNGRYLVFLNAKREHFNYTGIDYSQQLIDVAKNSKTKATTSWFVQDLLHDTLPIDQVNLIVCWGVLHHIPGFENRIKFLGSLSKHLAQNGFIVVSFWQFLYYERFRKKVIPLSQTDISLNETDLEPNDVLLYWNDPTLFRYCHHFDTEEINQYSELPSLTKVASFQSDGQADQYNHCVVWKKD